jgi:hypothetical protein
MRSQVRDAVEREIACLTAGFSSVYPLDAPLVAEGYMMGSTRSRERILLEAVWKRLLAHDTA